MTLPVLVVLSLATPLVWGWGVYRMVDRYWPSQQVDAARSSRDPQRPPPPDYQI